MNQSPNPVLTPRRWIVAALLNLFGFGVGYIYLGRPKLALCAATLTLAGIITIWTGLGGWLFEPFVATIIFIGFGALTLGFVIHAGWCATSAGNDARRWYNRRWIYAAAILLGSVIMSLHEIPATGIKLAGKSFSFPSQSMEPTARLGEHGFANMRAFDKALPERGDVVIFRATRLKAIYLKRVIGIPGDDIQLKANVLNINGSPVQTESVGTHAITDHLGIARSFPLKRETLPGGRTIIVIAESTTGPMANTPSFRVPAGHYFLIGDNRDNSADSRVLFGESSLGFAPAVDIIGKLSFISYARDWSRIGTRVK